MNLIGNKLLEARKMKGLTQEELADLSKVNLRTIQRIENNENIPRGKTLHLICDALEINSAEVIDINNKIPKNSVGSIILNGLFLILLNLLLMVIFSFMTAGQDNLKSKLGAFLLSFFIPFFIVYWTPKMSGGERVIKFGSGLMIQVFIVLQYKGIGKALQEGLTSSFLFYFIIIFIGVLFYGEALLKAKK